MATGDIHNHNGTICRAEKGRCPFDEEGHSKDIDSYVAHHVEESGVDGDQIRAMIDDGTPPGDAVEVAKLGLSVSGSTTSKDSAQVEVPRWKRGMVEDALENGDYSKLHTRKTIEKLSTEEWEALTSEQEAKVNDSVAELQAAERESGYSRTDPSELDFNEFAAGATFDDLKTRIRNLKKNSDEEPGSHYKSMLYNDAVARLERLERIVRPGEEASFWKRRNSELATAEKLEEAVYSEREKLKSLQLAAEKRRALS